MSLMTKKYAALAQAHIGIAKSAQRRFGVANGEKVNEIEALEHLDRGARCFFVAEKRLRAAESYHKCGEICLRIGGQDRDISAAIYFALSGSAREILSPHDACETYQRAAELCCDAGRWELAAVLAYRIALLGDREGLYSHQKQNTYNPNNNNQQRFQRYLAAADLFGAALDSLGDNKKIGLRDYCLEHAAIDLAITHLRYNRAAQLFELLARRALDTNLTQANATQYYFRAALCFLANDNMFFTRGKLHLFALSYTPFTVAPERIFIDDILDCFLQDKDDAEIALDSDSSSDDETVQTNAADNSTLLSSPKNSGNNYDRTTQKANFKNESRPQKYRDVPNLDNFIDHTYDLCTVRELNAFELTLLKRIHQLVLKRIANHQRRLERRRIREEKRKQKEENERQRRLRLQRDALSRSRITRQAARAKLALM
mmetsp:Transcript_8918/g.12397  ORF Transcript_8918/g.12397 Transcript_8918/m.12397 type:complete len:430 (+) Transcript_8918:260-1549(+)|eukprot:CAMPEP_0197297672 /NCGR_PEP_ID=MMETSP0890-20130614/41699_1 /TAXON_ID=44058 ORGANISM="Aureoumbra lagunensis, Strain CCMP1510" /NCGR_SAMPLE_ID=MMETSP0890 /ASSEMBLY_ACC=CAM_ASM_000533 /LENGTH=429 /DNA_ID=CAMNT_0042774961 /DNA_START=158 /DNA_END=1447 /DNA_ORIENTATION=-